MSSTLALPNTLLGTVRLPRLRRRSDTRFTIAASRVDAAERTPVVVATEPDADRVPGMPFLRTPSSWQLTGTRPVSYLDHVAVAPAGVLAITARHHHVIADSEGHVQRAWQDIRTAKGAAKLLELTLEDDSVEVRPVLVLWGPGAPELENGYLTVKGVTIIDPTRPELWSHLFDAPGHGRDPAGEHDRAAAHAARLVQRHADRPCRLTPRRHRARRHGRGSLRLAGSIRAVPPLDAARVVLRGESDRAALADHVQTARRLIVLTVVGANVVGAAIVLILLGVVLPRPRGVNGEVGGVTALIGVVAGLYVLAAVLAGTLIGVRLARPVIGFLVSTREPDEHDRRAVLRLPLQLFWLQCVLWGIAVVFFGVITLPTSALLAFQVATTTALAGVTTASFAYLLAQRLLRAGVAVVLADAPPRRREVPGVRPRALLAWALGIVPVGGAIVLAGFAPSTGIGVTAFAHATIVLCGVGVAVGATAMLAFARTVAGPLQRLRDAFVLVEAGHFDVEVPVFDATEVGYAAASFNRMAAGLRERERLRDLFGRQVGADVARQALEQGVTLGGEERIAAALFVDVIGSTTFAADRPPTEVVDALNAFFEAVVGATQDHGGLVNKFIGDAALCVFGAPLTQDDPAGAALAAARDMIGRLDGVELDAGIGVAFGTVVAGNVGTAERYEYTVIGDPVNEAARITELAKQRGGRVLASADTLERAAEDESGRWQFVHETTLRGRTRPTRLAEPNGLPEDRCS